MAKRRRGELTETDRATWASYARTVVPLSTRELSPERELPPESEPLDPAGMPVPPSVAPVPDRRIPPRAALSGLTVGEHPGGLDNGSWNRLRSGKVMPTRTLDLHGRTVQRAHHALHVFLVAAHADHVRCVEIITGKGSGENGGAIRRELPIWLNSAALRPLVLAASYPHAANTGAVRLLLRRPR